MEHPEDDRRPAGANDGGPHCGQAAHLPTTTVPGLEALDKLDNPGRPVEAPVPLLSHRFEDLYLQ